MDLELINKLDELIAIFENSQELKKIEKLKKEIYNDPKIKEKLERFNSLKNNIYSNEYLNLKKEILNIEIIKEYKTLENELLLLTFAINQKLNTLTNNKRCNHENN